MSGKAKLGAVPPARTAYLEVSLYIEREGHS